MSFRICIKQNKYNPYPINKTLCSKPDNFPLVNSRCVRDRNPKILRTAEEDCISGHVVMPRGTVIFYAIRRPMWVVIVQ